MTVSEDRVAPRYVVYSAFKPDTKINVYEGNNYESAKRTANFWDERQDTWFYDRERLTSTQRVDLQLIEMMARIEADVQNIPLPNDTWADFQMGRARSILAGEH